MNLSQVKKQNPTYLTDVILTEKRGNKRFYIDPRTEKVPFPEVPTVKPFAWNHTYLWLVCPHCQRIHQYSILVVRKNKGIMYGNCKGRINNVIDQAEIKVDDSEMKVSQNPTKPHLKNLDI